LVHEHLRAGAGRGEEDFRRMQDKDTKASGRRPLSGVRLGVLNSILIVIAIAASAVLLYTARDSIDSYRGMQALTERYMSCQQDAILFRDASDYLTQECRYFVTTGDAAHARCYVEEIEVARRREQAIEGLDDMLVEARSYDLLARGLELSDALAETECYAMRLAADARGTAPDTLPARIREAELSEQDAVKVGADKLARAMELLFGEEYQRDKAEIDNCAEQSINTLVEDLRQRQRASSNQLSRLLLRQQALTGLMLVVLLVAVLCTYLLVIRPLRQSVACIRDEQNIPVTGSREMQFLAQAYNDMFAQQTRSTEKLAYSATHDSLTGLYNRTAYDAEYRKIDPATVVVIIIDVDKFKTFNDQYGHDIGDRVLQRVARVLAESFRSEDFVSRIGGDEFCVIMKNVDSRMRGLVEGKIVRANERLAEPQDGLPSISLSVGAAFGDRENPSGDIFKDADTALYEVKHRGGRGCKVY